MLISSLLYSAWNYLNDNIRLRKGVIAVGTAGYMIVLTLLFLNDINFVNDAGIYNERHTPYISIFNKNEIENYIDISENIYYPGFIYKQS